MFTVCMLTQASDTAAKDDTGSTEDTASSQDTSSEDSASNDDTADTDEVLEKSIVSQGVSPIMSLKSMSSLINPSAIVLMFWWSIMALSGQIARFIQRQP